jgi:hypothetical protein
MFKEYFKYYKRINSLEHQSNVIDFENVDVNEIIVSYSYNIMPLLKCIKFYLYFL